MAGDIPFIRHTCNAARNEENREISLDAENEYEVIRRICNSSCPRISGE
jgi:hypothetical protein